MIFSFKVWDRRDLSDVDPKPVGVLAGHLDGITFIDSRGDGRHLITNSKDQTIKLWDIRKFSSEATQVNMLLSFNLQKNKH
jgi:WD repeat-containing protein 23